MSEYILKVDCEDDKGIIHKLTGVIFYQGLNILTNNEFVEKKTNHFFMRSEISGQVNPDTILTGLKETISQPANIQLIKKRKKKIIIMATKEHHCLADLLIRNEYCEMNAQVMAVICNYPELESLTQKFNLPFHYVSHLNKSRKEHEQEIIEILSQYNPEYIILAKYMRILSKEFVNTYNNKIINIHHSFLPAFIGVNPYEQAFERGVKIIGATSHFVNEKLDEGPIIVQETIHIDHRYTTIDMEMAGKEIEKLTLSKALKYVFEDRVFIFENKTIIFE